MGGADPRSRKRCAGRREDFRRLGLGLGQRLAAARTLGQARTSARPARSGFYRTAWSATWANGVVLAAETGGRGIDPRFEAETAGAVAAIRGQEPVAVLRDRFRFPSPGHALFDLAVVQGKTPPPVDANEVGANRRITSLPGVGGRSPPSAGGSNARWARVAQERGF